MKLLLSLSLLCLMSLASGQQGSSSLRSRSSSDANPQLVLLSSRGRCRRARVRNVAKCGCFYAENIGVANGSLRNTCTSVLRGRMSSFRSACRSYRRGNGNLREKRIFRALARAKKRCFRRQAPRRRRNVLLAQELFDLINQLCAALGQPTASNVPTRSRIVENDVNRKFALLKEFNNL